MLVWPAEGIVILVGVRGLFGGFFIVGAEGEGCGREGRLSLFQAWGGGL